MTDTPAIHGQMLAVMRAIGAVAKGDRNSEQGYSFRGVDAVVNAVGPALRDAGIFLLPEVVELNHAQVRLLGRGGNERQAASCTPVVCYRFISGTDGSQVSVTVAGEAIDYGDKVVAKAMSVAYRIMLLQVFAIPTDDVEPDAETYERAAPSPRRPSAPAHPPAEPYTGTDDDFTIDVANLEEVRDLDALRELWRSVTASGRPDLANAVSLAVQRIKDSEGKP